MFLPSVLIVCSPSKSRRTSSGVLPWTEFQYCEVTMGILLIIKYLFSRSNAALAPPRRQLTTAAAGLFAKVGAPQ
jgi:hypothetical protein